MFRYTTDKLLALKRILDASDDPLLALIKGELDAELDHREEQLREALKRVTKDKERYEEELEGFK